MSTYTKLASALMLVITPLTATWSKENPTASVPFKENKGQVTDQNYSARKDVLFYGQANGFNFYLTGSGLSYQLVRFNEKEKAGELPQPKAAPGSATIYRLDISWPGASKNARITKGELIPGYENYYNGAKPVTVVKSYSHVMYHDLYSSIDLKYYSSEGNVKYDYLVRPGGNISDIKIKLDGATSIVKNEDGSIKINTPLGAISEGAPKVYQGKKQISASWVINDNVLSFNVGDYDKTQTLIIDPLVFQWEQAAQSAFNLSFSTESCVATNNGDIFWCGYTYSYIGFFRKASSTNGVLFNTFLTPVSASNSMANDLALDSSGNLYVVGTSNSTTNFATTGAYQTTINGSYDAFMLKASSTGTIIWASYYGGTATDGFNACAVGADGNIYATGTTTSANNISSTGSLQTAVGGGCDAFLVKFNSNGARIWATYYGGAGNDSATGCAASKTGDIYICGRTSSSTGIATAGSFQPTFQGTVNGYIAKFDTTGVRQWATYYGTDSTTTSACDLDSLGYIYICGRTTATTNFATAGSFQSSLGGLSDAYLAKLNPAGGRVWTTYLGGAASDAAAGCSVMKNKVYVVGNTNSATNISTPGSYQPNASAYFSGWVTLGFLEEYDTSGQRLWGTYNHYFSPSSGWTVVRNCFADTAGNVYIVGMAASQTAGGSPNIKKFSRFTLATPTVTGSPSSAKFCPGGSVLLSISALNAATTYQWYRNDTLIAGATSPTYAATTAGNYKISALENSLTVTSPAITVTAVYPASTTVTSTNVSCNGAANGSISVNATGNAPFSYAWTNLSATTAAVSNLSPGTYVATTTDANSCLKKDTVIITQPAALAAVKTKTNVSCFGGNNGSGGVTISGGTTPYSYSWSNGPSTSSISTLTVGSYVVTVTDAHNCTKLDTITITQPTAISNTKTGNNIPCFGGSNGSGSVVAGGGTPPYTYLWSTTATTAGINNLAAGTYTVVIKDANNCTKNDTITLTQPSTALSTTVSSVNNTCYNDSVGKGFVVATGGTPSYTYSWKAGVNVISTLDSAVHLKAGTYVVTTKDANLCQEMDTITITEPQAPLVDICAVTVDSATGQNLVIWEKTGIQNAGAYKVYKESSVSGQYNLIGTNLSNAFSTFLDVSSNPLQQAATYKMSVVDSCGNESPMSGYHKTIHLSANTGVNGEINLIWNLYEGKMYNTHYIMRSVNGGAFAQIAQVSSTATSYSDLTPPAGQKTYRIDIDLASTCNPTAKTTSYNRISSNTMSQGVNGIRGIGRNGIRLVPNPTNDIINIIGDRPASIKVLDIQGKLVAEQQNTSSISLKSLAAGVYVLRLYDKEGILYYYEKIIKE